MGGAAGMVIVGCGSSPNQMVLPPTVAGWSTIAVGEVVAATVPDTGAPGSCWAAVTELFWYGNVTTTADEASGFDSKAARATLAPMRIALPAMTPPRTHVAGRRRMAGATAPTSGDWASASPERTPLVRPARPILT